jgi:hypothetical protein
MRVVLLSILLAGCTPGLQSDPTRSPIPDDDDATDDDATDDDDAVNLDGACDLVGGTSTLPGACIRFDAGDGLISLEAAAAGVSIPYTVLIEAPVDDVVPLPQDEGTCGTPGPSGLIVFERLQGGAQIYCVCDEGRCGEPDRSPRTIPAGATERAFEWTGRNWTGPSDTGMPLGEPFRAGIYTLSVSATGRRLGENFVVANTFVVTLAE